MAQTETRAPARNDSVAASADRELVITRVFDAPRNLVFRAWTEREHLWHWLGPKGFTTTLFEGDLRRGGAWRASMRSPEGKEVSQHGVVRQVSPPERFVFTQTWDDDPDHGTLVSILLTERDGRTTMRFRQGDFETIESQDSHENGWNQSFDRLEQYLAIMRQRRPGSAVS